MKKLRLESLEVTSFEPLPAQPRGRGTVEGQAEYKTDFNCPTYPQGFSIHIECNYVTSPLYNCTVDCSVDCTADVNCNGDTGGYPAPGA